MQLDKRILMSLAVLLLAIQAPAVQPLPDLPTEKANAAWLAQNGDATKAFNFLQDKLICPHVDQVRYDLASDLFRWHGPVTGKEMSMGRERFLTQIWYPYFVWGNFHSSF
jgi:hypothetical protein